jgi:hypothetical protein
VAWPLGDHSEEKKAKLAIVEQPAAMAATVMSVTSVAVVVMMMIGQIIGGGKMMVGAISASLLHGGDIGHDISQVKIYRIFSGSVRKRALLVKHIK